jgi:hypothetical protein
MSSDQHHTNLVLTRANYEEAFLLYVDGELTPAERSAVEAFAAQHPDLKKELDLLCGTKLPADAVLFENKEDLLADSMKVAAVEELLLLYIDRELPAPEMEKVATQLRNDALLATQYALLLKTKSDRSDVIPYPDKKELYRHTERRTAPHWLRIAAAVILLAGAGTFLLLRNDGSTTADPGVAVAIPKDTNLKTPPVAHQPHTKLPEEKVNNGVKQQPAIKNTIAVVKKEKKGLPKPSFSKPHTAPEAQEATPELAVAKTKKTDAPNLGNNKAEMGYQPSLSNPVVTSEKALTYVPVEAAAKTQVPVEDAVATGEERNGGLKGFLRKATRTLERRTGIKAVNDDDELLVGAVALKLK